MGKRPEKKRWGIRPANAAIKWIEIYDVSEDRAASNAVDPNAEDTIAFAIQEEGTPYRFDLGDIRDVPVLACRLITEDAGAIRVPNEIISLFRPGEIIPWHPLYREQGPPESSHPSLLPVPTTDDVSNAVVQANPQETSAPPFDPLMLPPGLEPPGNHPGPQPMDVDLPAVEHQATPSGSASGAPTLDMSTAPTAESTADGQQYVADHSQAPYTDTEGRFSYWGNRSQQADGARTNQADAELDEYRNRSKCYNRWCPRNCINPNDWYCCPQGHNTYCSSHTTECDRLFWRSQGYP